MLSHFVCTTAPSGMSGLNSKVQVNSLLYALSSEFLPTAAKPPIRLSSNLEEEKCFLQSC